MSRSCGGRCAGATARTRKPGRSPSDRPGAAQPPKRELDWCSSVKAEAPGRARHPRCDCQAATGTPATNSAITGAMAFGLTACFWPGSSCRVAFGSTSASERDACLRLG